MRFESDGESNDSCASAGVSSCARGGEVKKKKMKALVYFEAEDRFSILRDVDTFIPRTQRTLNKICDVAWNDGNTYKGLLLGLSYSAVELKKVEAEYRAKLLNTIATVPVGKQARREMLTARRQIEAAKQVSLKTILSNVNVLPPIGQEPQDGKLSLPVGPCGPTAVLVDENVATCSTSQGSTILDIGNSQPLSHTVGLHVSDGDEAAPLAKIMEVPTNPCLCADIISKATPENIVFLEALLNAMKRNQQGLPLPVVPGSCVQQTAGPTMRQEPCQQQPASLPGSSNSNQVELVPGTGVFINKATKREIILKNLGNATALTRALYTALIPNFEDKQFRKQEGPKIIQAVELFVRNIVESKNKDASPTKKLVIPNFKKVLNRKAASLRRKTKRDVLPQYGYSTKQKIEYKSCRTMPAPSDIANGPAINIMDEDQPATSQPATSQPAASQPATDDLLIFFD